MGSVITDEDSKLETLSRIAQTTAALRNGHKEAKDSMSETATVIFHNLSDDITCGPTGLATFFLIRINTKMQECVCTGIMGSKERREKCEQTEAWGASIPASSGSQPFSPYRGTVAGAIVPPVGGDYQPQPPTGVWHTVSLQCAGAWHFVTFFQKRLTLPPSLTQALDTQLLFYTGAWHCLTRGFESHTVVWNCLTTLQKRSIMPHDIIQAFWRCFYILLSLLAVI